MPNPLPRRRRPVPGIMPVRPGRAGRHGVALLTRGTDGERLRKRRHERPAASIDPPGGRESAGAGLHNGWMSEEGSGENAASGGLEAPEGGVPAAPAAPAAPATPSAPVASTDPETPAEPAAPADPE